VGGRSPRLQRRVNSLTNDDVISFTFSNYDADVDDNEKEHSSSVREMKSKKKLETGKKSQTDNTELESKKMKDSENGNKVDENEEKVNIKSKFRNKEV